MSLGAAVLIAAAAVLALALIAAVIVKVDAWLHR